MPFDGTQLDETTKDLIAARDLLVRRGWCAYVLDDSAGRHCALGAIYAISAGYNTAISAGYNTAAVVRLAHAIPGMIAPVSADYAYRAVPQFNNSQTDVQVILDWFDRAIAAQ